MWFIWSYALGAAAILFIALLEQHDKESTTSQIHLRMLQSLRTFFLERSHHTQSATSVIRMSQQAVSLIDSMLALRSHRLNASSLENRLTDLMNIFNRVAKSLGGPNGAGTLSKQSKTAVDPLLHPFTDAQFQDWLNVTQPPSPSEPPAWDPVNSFYPDSALTSWAPNFARAAENVAANAPVRSPLQSEQHWSFNTVFGIEDMLNTTWSSTLTST